MTGPIATELIPVRTDERFDEAVLHAYCYKLQGGELPLRVEQFAGGHANLTYLLPFGDGDRAIEYVLRRPPLGPVRSAPTICTASTARFRGSGTSFPLLRAPISSVKTRR